MKMMIDGELVMLAWELTRPIIVVVASGHLITSKSLCHYHYQQLLTATYLYDKQTDGRTESEQKEQKGG